MKLAYLLNSYPMTIVGVSAAGFSGLDPARSPQIRVPIQMKPRIVPEWFWVYMDSPRTRWVQVFARLKPGWTKRWMLDPALMSPGTAMPSGLFRMDNGHYVFTGPTPPSFNGYQKDHADLLVRYMFQFTPEELGRLRSSAGAAN